MTSNVYFILFLNTILSVMLYQAKFDDRINPFLYSWQEGKILEYMMQQLSKAKISPKHCYCRDEAFSEYLIRTCTVAQFRYVTWFNG